MYYIVFSSLRMSLKVLKDSKDVKSPFSHIETLLPRDNVYTSSQHKNEYEIPPRTRVIIDIDSKSPPVVVGDVKYSFLSFDGKTHFRLALINKSIMTAACELWTN